MTKFTQIIAASASVFALAAAGASAQDYTDGEDSTNSAEELNQGEIQSTDDATMQSDMQAGTDANTDGMDKDLDWEAKANWDAKAEATLAECAALSEACTIATRNAAGVLVFPELTSASFVVGGTGGTGVLMVDGEPAGYYRLAAGSLGFQAGIDQVSQVMTFNTDSALSDLTGDAEWKAGANANVTVIDEGATADAIVDGDLDSLGEVSSITFNQEGLAGGVALEGMRIAAIGNDADEYGTDTDFETDFEADIETEIESDTSY